LPKKRSLNRDKARTLWIESDRKRLLKDIAAELGVSDSTIRKWKSVDHWAEESKGSAPIEKERYGTMHENQNAVGNSGGAPPGNKNAVTHGLFAKWLPDETADILKVVEDQKPADMLWQNITLQYTAIIRAQKIMYVKDIKKKTTNYGTMEVQYAWDKQANFLAAQSRAMGTLSNLIKQFVAITDDSDIRRKRLDLMTAQVAKANAEVAQIKRDSDRDNMPLPIFVDVPMTDDEGGDEADE